MKRITIFGLRGGVGATTVAANLTVALNTIERPCYVLDMNKDNLLRLHFNMDMSNGDGWAARILENKPWQQGAYQNQQDMTFIPYGYVDKRDKSKIDTWQEEHISKLIWNDRNLWQIMLLPSFQNLTQYHMKLVEASDLCIGVINPDIQNYILLNQDQIWIEFIKRYTPKILVNKYQSSSDINRDLLLVLQQEYMQSLIPVAISRDAFVPESVAELASVMHYAPHSQVTQDMHTLAIWCLAELTRRIE